MKRPLLSRDTSAEAERVQIALWRAMSPLEKARAVSAASRAVQQLSLAGIRHRHPRATDDECWLFLATYKLGAPLARRAYRNCAGQIES